MLCEFEASSTVDLWQQSEKHRRQKIDLLKVKRTKIIPINLIN